MEQISSGRDFEVTAGDDGVTWFIAAAALDVTGPEPIPADDKLLDLPNLIIAPHIASATMASRTLMAQMAVQNCIAGVLGNPLPFPVNTA